MRVEGSAVAGGPAGGTHVQLPGVAVQHAHGGRREWRSPIVLVPTSPATHAAERAALAAEADRRAAELASIRHQRYVAAAAKRPKRATAFERGVEVTVRGVTFERGGRFERKCQDVADELTKLWDSGMPRPQIAARLGVGRSTLSRIVAVLDLPKRRRTPGGAA